MQKLSSPSYVWMEITLKRPGSSPGHEEWRPPQGDPTMQQLYQGAEEKPEECKTEESLVQLRSAVERKVASSNPTDDEVFLGHSSLRKLTIMMESQFHVPIQSWLGL